MTHGVSALSVGTLLSRPVGGVLPADPALFGFGGLHGGLALAMLTSAMQEQAPERRLRTVTAQFHKPITVDATVETSTLRAGRTMTTVEGRASTTADVHDTASGIFSPSGPAACPTLTQKPPSAPAPLDCETFTVPPEFVPIAGQTEIRPVGAARPYAGGAEAELTAWVRLVEDDSRPDALRLVFLMDALAPSYAAIMSTLQLVPTVELSVSIDDAAADAVSPWVLLRARTRIAGGSGWSTEELDAWGPDGAHLASGRQTRFTRMPST